MKSEHDHQTTRSTASHTALSLAKLVIKDWGHTARAAALLAALALPLWLAKGTAAGELTSLWRDLTPAERVALIAAAGAAIGVRWPGKSTRAQQPPDTGDGDRKLRNGKG